MIRLIEELSMNAFPSEKLTLYDGWVIRLSPGSASKRVNSVNPLYQTNLSLNEKISACEHLFKATGSRSVFKMTSESLPAELDLTLHQNGYYENARTMIMTKDIHQLPNLEHKNLSVTTSHELTGDWLNQFCSLSGKTESHHKSLEKTLSKILPPQLYISVSINNVTTACAMGVVESGYVGIYNVVVDKMYRRKGLGNFIMNTLLHEAYKLGARKSYLQVESKNTPAVSLYKRLGYNSLYEYWYRIKEES